MNTIKKFLTLLIILPFFNGFEVQGRAIPRPTHVIKEIVEVIKNSDPRPIVYNFFVVSKDKLKELPANAKEIEVITAKPKVEEPNLKEVAQTIVPIIAQMEEKKEAKRNVQLTFRALFKKQAQELLAKASDHKKKIAAASMLIAAVLLINSGTVEIKTPGNLLLFSPLFDSSSPILLNNLGQPEGVCGFPHM